MLQSKLTANNFALMNRMLQSGDNYMFMGAPGIGKSQMMIEFTEANNLGYVELVLSQIEAVDVRGIMVPQRKADNSAPDTVSTRTPLAAMVDAEIAKGRRGGVIFFDEYYQAELGNRKAVSQFLTSRKIGDWSLPDGWVIWGASNPKAWRAGTIPPMGHEVTRWIDIEVSPDVSGWLAWAAKNNVHHLYRAFVERFPHEVFVTTPPEDRTTKHCNPRALMYAHNFHTLNSNGNDLACSTDQDPIEFETIKGAIGVGAATALFGFLRNQDVMPSPADMLENPTSCKIPPIERIDARYACMMQAVAHANSQNIEPLFQFVQRLGTEMTLASLKRFTEVEPLALNAPSIARFIAANPEATMSLATH